MKKMKLFLTFTLFIMLNFIIVNVDASENDYKMGNTNKMDDLKVFENYSPYEYDLEYNGKWYPAICIDPAAVPGKDSIKKIELSTEDYAIIENILSADIEGLSDESYPFDTLYYYMTTEQKEHFYTKLIAVRVYTTNFSTTIDRKTSKIASGYVHIGKEWFENESWYAASYIQKNYSQDTLSKYNFVDADIEKNAKKLVEDAMENSSNNNTTEVVMPSIEVISGNSRISVDENNQKIISKTVTLNPQNFGENGMLNSLSITSADLSLFSSIKINGEEQSSLTDYALKDNKTITIELTGYGLDDDCDETDFSLTYTYYDDALKSDENVSREVVAFQKGSAYQRYIIYIESDGQDDGKRTETKPLGMDLCPYSCNTTITIPNTCLNVDGTYNEDDVAGVITGPTNIGKCITNTNAEDEAGNKYQAGGCSYTVLENGETKEIPNGLATVSTSKYCNVSCKEDYNPIKFSGVQRATSGRYFKVAAEISGTKSCYTNEINVDQFEIDIADASSRMKEALTASEEGTIDQAFYDAAKADFDKAVKDIESCTGWDMQYALTPTVEYTYEDNYFKDLEIADEDKNLNIVSDTNTDREYYYCTDGNKNYTDCENVIKDELKTSKNYSYVNIDGSSTGVSVNIPKTSYIKQSISKTVLYDTPEIFYTEFPTGNIIYNPTDEQKDQSQIVDGLPIDGNLENGLYNFKFTIKDLGEFYNNCEPGRLVNDDDRKSVAEELTDTNTTKFENEYVCKYLVDCPECEFEGDWEEFDPYCPNCIFTGNIDNLSFRTISLNNVNPNDRDMGYNFNTETNFGFISGKAEKTLGKIEDNEGIIGLGESIYEQTPVLSVEVTPDLAKTIRETNNDLGSYQNDTLTCYDYTENGVTYENVFCYSDYLDMFTDGDYVEYSENFTFANRPEEEQRTNNTSPYWQTYTTTDNKELYDDISKDFGIDDDTTIGGPSWK